MERKIKKSQKCWNHLVLLKESKWLVVSWFGQEKKKLGIKNTLYRVFLGLKSESYPQSTSTLALHLGTLAN